MRKPRFDIGSNVSNGPVIVGPLGRFKDTSSFTLDGVEIIKEGVLTEAGKAKGYRYE
jgi:hypothetical protein